MSNAFIFGNFGVFAGETIKSGRVNYMVYKTSILTDDDGPGFRGTIRVYAGTHQATLEDDSIVFIYGKVYAPSDEPFLIEAVYMFAYPREVVENSLDQLMLFAPRLCILGHVCGNVETTYEGRRIFKVLSTAYVRDSLKVTSFMAFLDHTSRWKRTAAPNPNSAVQLIGRLHGRHELTRLSMINVEDLIFNAGSRSDTNGGDEIQRGRSARHSASSAWGDDSSREKESKRSVSPIKPLTGDKDESLNEDQYMSGSEEKAGGDIRMDEGISMDDEEQYEREKMSVESPEGVDIASHDIGQGSEDIVMKSNSDPSENEMEDSKKDVLPTVPKKRTPQRKSAVPKPQAPKSRRPAVSKAAKLNGNKPVAAPPLSKRGSKRSQPEGGFNQPTSKRRRTSKESFAEVNMSSGVVNHETSLSASTPIMAAA